MKKSSMRDILDCASKWRSAEIHAAACRLGFREDEDGTAEEVLENRLKVLRIKLDFYKQVYGDV